MGKDGFTSGDFDPAFPLDDKFITLSTLVADRAAYYEAVGVYWLEATSGWHGASPALCSACSGLLVHGGRHDPEEETP